jgi:methylthioribose-1-phosphate isomerase
MYLYVKSAASEYLDIISVTNTFCKMLDAIKYDHEKKTLSILNQLLLPHETVFEEILSTKDAWDAIKSMKVRGAPAIAIVGLLSLAVELKSVESFTDKESLFKFIEQKCDFLCSARPTAVNIKRECQLLLNKSKVFTLDPSCSVEEMTSKVSGLVGKILEEDIRVNKSIGEHGAQYLLDLLGDKPLNILTHCNTGSLATAGYGTALGVMRSLQSKNKLNKAYCTETRPYNQGARLTAYEFLQESMNGMLVCDNMVAALLRMGSVDAVIVGADRVVANGDTANKIGTYQNAVLAKAHGVPFFVASPLSTIDLSLRDGTSIPIEERPANEMKSVGCVKVAPDDIPCWNPAFDVTPADLITGIITEKGVVVPNKLEEFVLEKANASK